MENGQKTIKNLFNGRTIFNIPKYQRAYTWEEKQIEEFVNDLENQDPDKDYFLGTILFQDRGMSDDFDHIDIVDGQQRITTLIIFIKLLIDYLEEHKDKTTKIAMLRDTYIQQYGEYKLCVLQDDNEFFKSYILQDNPVPNGMRTPSQRRLSDAKELLLERIKSYPLETLRELKDKIERMRVLTYSVKDNAEATQIFETTNDRGKSLTNLEKIKSFLMYNTYLVSPGSTHPDSILDPLQNLFGEIYRDYEDINNIDKPNIRLDEDLILQYHCIAFEKWTSDHEYEQPVQMIKDQVNKLVKADEKAKTEDFIKKCSRELKESFATVKTLLESEISYVLDIFALNRAAVSYSLLIKAHKLDDSEQKQNFKRVARLMEIICFRLGIGRYRVDRGRNQLYRLSRDFTGDFDALINELKCFVNGSDKNHGFCNDKDFERQLLSPNFYTEIHNSDQLYLFWKYENYLRKEKQPVSNEMHYIDFVNKDPRTKLSIDHIHPQHPKDEKIVEDKPETTQLAMSPEFEENYLHSIGNLVLDSISANSSKSNEKFDVKYKQYYSRSMLKQQQELKDFCKEHPEILTWDKSEIEKRREKILKFALDYWNHENV